MFEGIGDGEGVHFAAAVFARFDGPFQVVTGNVDGERIGDDVAGALVVLDPGGMRERDPDGASVGEELDVDGVGVAGGDGDDECLVGAVNVLISPAVFDGKFS